MPKKSAKSRATGVAKGEGKRPSPVTGQPAKQPAPKVGNGGEHHQPVQGGQVLTSAQGAPLSDDQNSLRAGERGPTLLEDFAMREKIFHFDHERIPERVVHARGYGAHGTFETTADLSAMTSAAIFAKPGAKTEAFVRFSTVAGAKGSFDLARDVRGFAVKLYTTEGNWDIVGNNIPVFFIQDAIKFPDLVHAVKEAPDRAFPQAQSAHDRFWDFVSFTPEAIHMTLWQMSDRAIPRSFRFMEGFGVHTFRFVNADGASSFVKFHWRPLQGLQSVVWNEAVKINGADPDFHRRDLWDAITSGDLPQWDLAVQVFDESFAEEFDFDVLDATKLIPEELVPLQVVGRLTLDRVVDNDFAETEQVAFGTGNVPPGIDFSDDPLLQGRNFSYLDTQLSRLGTTNFTQLPVNAPRCPVAHFQRDGKMQTEVPTGRVNYEPNGFGGAERGPRADDVSGLPELPGAGGRRQGAGAFGHLCRPLQPGPAVLHQPDAGRAGPHREGVHLRAQQVRDPAGADAHAGPPAQRARGLGDRRRSRAGYAVARACRRGHADTHRPAGFGRTQHPQEGAGQLCGSQDGRARHRRDRCRGAPDDARGAQRGWRRPGDHRACRGGSHAQ